MYLERKYAREEGPTSGSAGSGSSGTCGCLAKRHVGRCVQIGEFSATYASLNPITALPTLSALEALGALAVIYTPVGIQYVLEST